MQQYSDVSDEVMATRAVKLLKQRPDTNTLEYAEGAIRELKSQLQKCKSTTKRNKLEMAIRRWELTRHKIFKAQFDEDLKLAKVSK